MLIPVVILANMTANIAMRQADHFLDSQRKLCATQLVQYSPFSYLRPQELIEQGEAEKARDVSEGVRIAYVGAGSAGCTLSGDGQNEGMVNATRKGDIPEG